LLSLDGVAEEPGNWMSDSGPELFANLGRTIETQDDVLLGRGTYDYWVDYWPTSDVEPFASFINGTPKHVFTSSEPDASWDNTTLVAAPAVDYVRQLKQGTAATSGFTGASRSRSPSYMLG
jgi:dihydrofolate reductase